MPCGVPFQEALRPGTADRRHGYDDIADTAIDKLTHAVYYLRILASPRLPQNERLPMRLYTFIASALFTAGGVCMIASGDSYGWGVAGFFGLCLLVAIFEPRFAKRQGSSEYRLVITQDEVACEHPKRPRESIRWEEVIRIWNVTTSDGPWRPDQWILLEGEMGGCSFPMEAAGFDGMWGELKQRFAGFDYDPLVRGGTNDARHLCWDRQRQTSRRT
jgi:hypothetical protein